MKVNDIKDLKKLIDLCRRTGVEAIEVDGVKMNLGTSPTIIYKTDHKKTSEQPTYTPGGVTEDTRIDTDVLTDEQLMFYSSDVENQQQ